MINKQNHLYGPKVHLFDHAYYNGLLAQLCSPKTFQPQINHFVEVLYKNLMIQAMTEQFTLSTQTFETRMSKDFPKSPLVTHVIESSTKVVSVNIARAGTFPSHVCFEKLHDVILPENLRQDHIFAARSTNGKNEVIGSEIGATKIGGDQNDCVVIFPDPMGATGNTLLAALDYYKTKVPGRAKKYIALHLIVTPEYLKKVVTNHPDTEIYAYRLDRGLSSEQVLSELPGKLWDQEKGLSENGYIVPGGGGFGEIMNNSFV